MMKVTFLFHLMQGKENSLSPLKLEFHKAGIVPFQCSPSKKCLVKGKCNLLIFLLLIS